MARTESLTALNLRTYPLGENDKIVVVFTRERGILRLAARGARKTGNKWAGRLEPLARNAIAVARGRGSLEALVTADTRVSGAALMGDLDRIMTGLRLAEVTAALLPEAEPHEAYFDALETALDLLMDRACPARVAIWFELTALDLAGYRPELSCCVVCGAVFPPGAARPEYSAVAGGLRCPACPYPARPVGPVALAVLRELQDAPPARVPVATGDPGALAEASGLLAETIARQAQTKIHAADLMRKLAVP